MRKNNFDFLRFLFAFIVVVGHIIALSGVENFKTYQPFFSTYISITGFFCISGFLIVSSFERTKSVKNYFQKRAARILPAYILIILLCATGLSFISNYSLVEYFTNLQFYKYLGANLSFLNFLQPCLPGVFEGENFYHCAVNGALWTIKVEVSFYLLLPIFVYFLRKSKRKYILLLFFYIFAIIFRNVFIHYSEKNDLFIMFARQLPGFMSYFVCGMALFYYFDFFIKYKNIFCVIGLFLLVVERIIGCEILTPFALSAVIFTVAFSFDKLNNFGKYGDISYGIYIFHFPIIQLAIHFGFFEKYNPFIVAFCLVLLIICTGFLSWHLLEKKFLKKYRT